MQGRAHIWLLLYLCVARVRAGDCGDFASDLRSHKICSLVQINMSLKDVEGTESAGLIPAPHKLRRIAGGGATEEGAGNGALTLVND